MSAWHDQKQIGYLINEWAKKKWSKCREQNSPRTVFMMVVNLSNCLWSDIQEKSIPIHYIVHSVYREH